MVLRSFGVSGRLDEFPILLMSVSRTKKRKKHFEPLRDFVLGRVVASPSLLKVVVLGSFGVSRRLDEFPVFLMNVSRTKKQQKKNTLNHFVILFLGTARLGMQGLGCKAWSGDAWKAKGLKITPGLS